MNGKASSSACARSWPTCVLAWALANAWPPSRTSAWPAKADLIAVVSSLIRVSDSGLKYAST